MEEYPANSHKSKAPDEKEKPEALTQARQRKKPLGKRMSDTFVGGDARGVWGYVFVEVLIPAAKDMIADAVRESTERILFGEARPRNTRTGGKNGYVAYRSASSPTPREGVRSEPRSLSRRARAKHEFDEIIIDTRAEANEVLDRMYEMMDRYQAVTVSDLYDMVGISANFTDEKWGWRELPGAKVHRVGDQGYLLNLPAPEPL